jgi:pimeloyl-ACP methyl ester carboxylesterase
MGTFEEGILTMPDGRNVGFADFGDVGGTAVIWCHGGPGCRLEGATVAAEARRAGLRLVGIDRPGYGRSTPQPGRTIGGWVDDALAVADELGLDTFATVGVSTGGAYALALAARSPRVIGAVACCSVSDMRWVEGRSITSANDGIWDAPSREAALGVADKLFGPDGATVRNVGAGPLALSDRAMFSDPAYARFWEAMVPEMLAHGNVGYTDDRIADGGGWTTFDVRRIRCPVVVLHGTDDTMVAVAHARHTQTLVPHASLDLRDGLGHFSIATVVVPVLDRLLAR